MQCTYCLFTSSVIKNVRAHKVDEHKLFVCRFSSCLSDWTVKMARNIHEQVHQESKFVCDTCEVQFDCKSVYNRHLVKHADTQDFVCSILSCQRKGNLVAHSKVHKRCAVLTCDDCGYTCKQRHYLTYHRQRHEAPRIHCNSCSRLFRYHEDLKCHRAKGDCV